MNEKQDLLPLSHIDPNIVQRFTGQHKIVDIDIAKSGLRLARQAYQNVLSRKTRLTQKYWRLKTRFAVLQVRHFIAKCPSSIGIEGWVILLVVASILALALGGLLILSLSGSPWEIALLMPLPFTLLGLSPVLFRHDTHQLEDAIHRCGELCSGVIRDLKVTEVMVQSCRTRLKQCNILVEGLEAARDYPLNRLLHANIDSMSGDEFEKYLQDVFLFLGYNVEHLGGSGDQGVDLIVSSGNERIAVQAKRYAGSVGNSAVQEVHTGMKIHGCCRCAAIASGRFTPGAKHAAQAVGCRLFGRHELELLIRGVIRL